MNELQIVRRKAKPEFFLWQAAKDRATKSGIEFSIEVNDIIIPEVCPVLGIPIIPANGKRSANSPSLDRRDNSRGYEKDNICVISWRANRLKNDATIKELEAVVNWMKG